MNAIIHSKTTLRSGFWFAGWPGWALFGCLMLAAAFNISVRGQSPCAVSMVYQDGLNGYTNTQDAAISSEEGGNGLTTYQGVENTAGELPVWNVLDYSNFTLLRFDNLSLPAGMAVESATLQLSIDNGYGGTELGISGFYLQSYWNAAAAPDYGSQGLGWIYRDTNVPWATPGVLGGADIVPGKEFLVTGESDYGQIVTKQISLDPAVVQNWCVNPAANQGVLLANMASNIPYIDMCASWNATPAYRPSLTIVAAPPGIARLGAAISADGKRLNLQWESCAGLMQQIQVSSDLVHWSNLPPVLVSATENSTWSDDGSLTGGLFKPGQPRYYRLLVQPEDFIEPAGAPINFLPASSGLTYAWDFGDGTTSASSNPSHTYAGEGTFAVTLTVVDTNGTHTASGTISAELPSQIFLTPAVLAGLRQKAAANTQQWQDFKQQLDDQLNMVIGPGAYEGSELSLIADYALGYKVLEFQDPATADLYADKAIGILKSALQDFQKEGEVAQQYLARGDGVTTNFTLPNTNVVSASLDVLTAPIAVVPVIRSATDTADSVGYYLTFIKVSDTSDGPADYQPGTDWQHTGDLENDLIDWSIAAPGHSPAPGATYYVTTASSFDANYVTASVTLAGNTITFASAPATNEAIYVQYVYGTHATNYATLADQQTSAGDGGFNSIYIDDGYTSRYLGKFTAMGYDWLQNYPGFSSTLKAEAAGLLVRWSDYWRDNGYYVNSPASNYGEGGYASRVYTALALGGGRDTNDMRLTNEMSVYRQAYVLPLLTNLTSSYYGGFWAEGWNYGQQAARNLIQPALAEEAAGLGPATAERTWAGEVIDNLIAEQPTETNLYDGGDWYSYPAPFVDNDLIYTLAVATTNATAQSHANYMIQNYPGSQTEDMQDLLFRDPDATAAFWPEEPRQNYASGTGLVTARADWSYNSTWMAFQLGNLLGCDHQTYAQGQLQVQRGADDLLINANEVGPNQEIQTESSFGNLIAVDDNGAGTQNYPFNQGFWFGTPGCFITAYEATNDYVYAAGDYTAAYSYVTTPGVGTATELTRQVVYLRPDWLVVHDRAATQAADDPKELRWHFLNRPTVNAASNSWVAASGNSVLFGHTFSRSALTTTNGAVNCPADGDTVVYRVATDNVTPATNVTYTTALETAPAGTEAMTNTTTVYSADGQMEGVLMGNWVVLFGANAPLAAFTTISYTVNGTAPLIHLLTDLPPNRACQIRANGVLLGNGLTSAAGTLFFTSTTAGAQVITIQ